MHLDNLIFFLLIAGAILIQAAAKIFLKRSDDSPDLDKPSLPSSNEPPYRPPAETDEERIRRFLEALGQPTSTKPPPRVAPRTNVPPRPLAPVSPPAQFPLPIPSRTLRRIVKPGARKQPPGLQPTPPQHQAPATIATRVESVGETVFEVQERAEVSEPPPATSTVAASRTMVVSQPETTPTRDRIDIAALLNSPFGLRDAIILREIFGPPRGLEPRDVLL